MTILDVDGMSLNVQNRSIVCNDPHVGRDVAAESDRDTFGEAFLKLISLDTGGAA